MEFAIKDSSKARSTDRGIALPMSHDLRSSSWPRRSAWVSRSHPFLDGNKRTALLAARAFLFLNGYALEPAEEDEVATMVAVADGSLDEPGIAAWLRRNSARGSG